MITNIDKNITLDFEAILDDDEKIIWAAKPIYIPYILTFIWANIFFLILGSVMLYFLIFSESFRTNKNGNPEYTMWISSIFLTVMGIVGILKAFMNFGNTAYCYSAKRVMIRSGFFGVDFRTIDFDKIADSEVNVNLIEKLYNVGSVKFSTGETDSKGKLVYQQFTSIENPYEIFKKVKQIGVDIKTDYNYPNALRPEKNPGYKTKYDPS